MKESVIKFQNVTKIYKLYKNDKKRLIGLIFKNVKYKEKKAVDDVSFEIKKGKVTGIIGHSGSGKSTLVRQLVRQLPIEEGTLYLNGIEIESFDQENVRKHVSYVPQEHMLFSRSVLKNVLIGDSDATIEEVNKAVELADFAKDIEMLNDGYDTIVGEYGVTLSGGQKQRLAIARAFLKDSDILILDDSLSAVDGKTEANIINTLKTYRKHKTNLIVAHRLSAVVHADEIIVLDKGQIIERGTHEELMNLNGWYHEQFIAQQMEEEKAGEE